jgi:hypothetical protein
VVRRRLTPTSSLRVPVWRQLDPRAARDLTDARLQVHHAAQLAAALGISYLTRQPDDSHTNLEWIDSDAALASKPAGSPPIRLAVRPHVLALLLLDDNDTTLATFLLNGRTIEDAVRWARAQLAQHALAPLVYTLSRHYEIPPHAVASGGRFEATIPAQFEELARWYSNASLVLGHVVADVPGASPVRCWPHHFDIATLITVAPGKTISVGMEPGDQYSREPYFYASMSPTPDLKRSRPALTGEGTWHTQDWMGAFLPASRLAATGQQAQVEEFLGSAVRACSTMVRTTP